MAKSKTDTDTGDQVDVAELRRQLDAANAEKETYRAQASTETQRRREAEKANMGAQERALVSELESSESRLESLEGDLNSMEEQIARLSDEPGQGKEVAKLNRRMAEAAAEHRESGNSGALASRRTTKNPGALATHGFLPSSSLPATSYTSRSPRV